MRVFVAGGTGVIGRPVLPLLVAAGHVVTGLAHTSTRVSAIEATGASAVVADALDPSAITQTVRAARPDVIVNLLSAIPAVINPRRMDRDFALTNRLRTEATRNLIDVGQALGSVRLISESIAFAYDPSVRTPADETAALWPDPPGPFAGSLNAIRQLEAMTHDAGGLSLRFGHLYGSGSSYATDSSTVAQIRAGKLPLVGGGGAVFSFIHAHDAATAVLAAVASPITGAVNVVDDDPAAVHEWLPTLATILGAPRPKSVPVAVARLVAGSWGIAFMTRLRGADNTRARAELGWRPTFGSWRVGFAAELSSGG